MSANIILFDGYCNFCNFWVNFIIKRDKRKLFKFASLQSEKGKEILNRLNIQEKFTDNVILVKENDFFIKSTASLKILKQLSSPLKLFSFFLIVPVTIRDFIYDLLALNRYKIFGKRKYCRIPGKNEYDRFLS